MKEKTNVPEGSIKVYKRDLIKDIGNNHGRNYTSKSTDDISISYSNLTQEKSVQNNLGRRHSFGFINGWISEKSVKNIQEKIDYECSDIRYMYNKLVKNENEIQLYLNEIIENDIEKKTRKKLSLSKKWNENAYLPLNKKIIEEMNGENYTNLDKEKRHQYTCYLNHQNNKEGHVFLDVYEKEEYDPLYLASKRPGPLKAPIEKLADPLLHLQDKRNEEDRVIYACTSGKRLTDKEIEDMRLPDLPKLFPLGRHKTKCSAWLDMELIDIQSDVRVRSQERQKGIRNNSNVCLKENETKDDKTDSVENIHFAKDWQKKRQFPKKYDTTIKIL